MLHDIYIGKMLPHIYAAFSISVTVSFQALIWKVVGIIILLAFFAYFAYAMYYRFGDEGSIRLLVCTILGVLILVHNYVHGHLAKLFSFINVFLTNPKYQKIRRIIRW